MEDMLGAGSLIPENFTRLTIGWLRASPGAYPVALSVQVTCLVGGPRMAIPLALRGKSLADDLVRTRCCNALSGLAATIA